MIINFQFMYGKKNDSVNGCMYLFYPILILLSLYGAIKSESIFMWIVFGVFFLIMLLILSVMGSKKQ